MCHWGHHLVLGARRDLGTVSCKMCLPVFILGASENVYLAMSLGLCMHACTGLCVLGDLICRSDHGSNLFFTLLPDKNSTLTKVFQSRKAQVPGHHSQSSWENTQMQDVTHLGQLAVKNLNANRVRGKFKGLHLWT